MGGWFQDGDTFQKAMNGILAAATAIGIIFGLTRKGPPKEEKAPSLEVVGQIINDKHASAVINALDMNTMALVEKKLNLAKSTEAMEGLGAAVQLARQAVESHTRAAGDIHRHAEDIVREMRDLRTEMRDLRDETKDLRDEMLRGGRPR